MTSSLLALIMSALIALSGAGALPAIPETAVQTTIRDISVTINDETYDIESEIVSTEAIGTDLAASTFEIQLGDDVLLPMQASIGRDAIRLAMGNTGRVYTLNEDALMELMSCDEAALAQIEAMLTNIAEMNLFDPASQLMMNRESRRVLADVLDPIESAGETTLNGKTVQINSYSGVMDAETISDLMDALANSESKALSNYVNNLLAYGNEASGTDYATWGEMLKAELANEEANEAIPQLLVRVDIAEDGDSYYMNSAFDIVDDANGVSMHSQGVQLLDEGDLSSDAEITFSVDELNVTMTGTMQIADALSDAPTTNFDICIAFAESTDGDDQEFADVTLTYGDQTVNDLFRCGLDLSIDFGTQQYSVVAEEDGPTAMVSRDPQHITFSFAADEAAAENGGKDCTVAMALYLNNGDVYSASFVVNTAEVPFDVPALFGDSNEITLTGAYDDPGMTQLLTDFMAIANDASALITDDSGIADLRDFFYKIYETDGSAYSYEYEDTNVYATPDEVMERFMGSKVMIDLPEGYVYDPSATYITADNTFANISYENIEGKYISLSLYCQDNGYLNFLQMSDDGLSKPIEDTVVTLNKFDDGGYYCASFYKGSAYVNLYFSEMPLEDVQNLLAGVHVVE